MSETNYERKFGTPEKAAEYLFQNSICFEQDGCERCLDSGHCDFTAVRDGGFASILEWLNEEA